MTNGMAALMVAVGGSSLAWYWLMTRVQSAAARRSNATGDNSGYSSGSTSDSGSGWNVLNWFSSDNSSSDNSVASDSSSSSGAETVAAVAMVEVVAINATVSAEVDLCR